LRLTSGQPICFLLVLHFASAPSDFTFILKQCETLKM
jgi:hypothetical protein